MAGRSRTVTDAGERALIGAIRRAVTRSGGGDPRQIGDDAATLPPTPRRARHEVISTDLLIEGTHWRSAHLMPAQLGRRALVANLSDLAAMGATPRWFTLGLGMPPDQPLAWFNGLIRGLTRAAAEFGCPLIGGDLVRAPVASIAITVSGLCDHRRPPGRRGAHPGDTIFVTGDLGRARLALDFLEGRTQGERQGARVLERHRSPSPRLAVGAQLVRSRIVHAMMDVSDGLASDLAWICSLSACGAEIDLESLPIEVSVIRSCCARGLDPCAYAATSGEEFELLFSSRASVERVRRAVGRDLAVTPIGRIVAGRGIRWMSGGKPMPAPAAGGFVHFA